MNNFTVYRHINKINGKQYIGITQINPSQRWGTNGINYRSSPHFYSAIKKYGWDNFEHEILFTNLSREEACQKEIDLIKQFKTQDKQFGYNVLEGGDCAIIPPEIREKMSKSMMGNKNGLGKPCSPEKRRKISEAQKGKIISDETRRKQSLARKGKKFGPQSEETRRKISQSHKKRQVYCKENGIIYESIQECARQTGITATVICACCKGRVKSSHGLHFCYYEPSNDIESLTTIPNGSTSKQMEMVAS